MGENYWSIFVFGRYVFSFERIAEAFVDEVDLSWREAACERFVARGLELGEENWIGVDEVHEFVARALVADVWEVRLCEVGF